MKKPVNHLASSTEQYAHYRLPYHAELLALDNLTNQLRAAWQTLLPSEALDGVRVYIDDGERLVISTANHTLCNHLTYHRQILLAELHQHLPELIRITTLQFRVITLKSLTAQPNLQCNQSVSNVNLGKPSATTRQNITQLAALVTSSDRLQRSLQKLLDG